MKQLPEVSILIKTFNRPSSLLRLLGSLVKTGNDHLAVLIADDSRESGEALVRNSFPHLNISYFFMPFDSGLSAGRNLLLSKVRTPYFVLCDDDFVFDDRTNISHVLQFVRSGEFDIIAGCVYNYISLQKDRILKTILHPVRLYRLLLSIPSITTYVGQFEVCDKDCVLKISHKMPDAGLVKADIVNNFFIAKTEVVQRIGGWDEQFKVGEHEDFFFRARMNEVKVGFSKSWGVKHYPVIRNTYKGYRDRALELKKCFPKKFGFTSYKEIDVDTGEVMFEA